MMFWLMIRTLTLALTFHLALGVAWASPGPPTEVVKHVVDRVLDISNDPAYAGQKTLRRQLAKQSIDPNFDYREMAKRCLGATWNSLSGSQRDEFVSLFAKLLEASYSDKIEKYTQHIKVDYAGERLDGDYAEVRTVVVRPNDRIPLNYRLIHAPEGWKVYDVVIEGVSLVSNYQSQFSRIIHESSYNELVRRLRTKVDEL